MVGARPLRRRSHEDGRVALFTPGEMAWRESRHEARALPDFRARKHVGREIVGGGVVVGTLVRTSNSRRPSASGFVMLYQGMAPFGSSGREAIQARPKLKGSDVRHTFARKNEHCGTERLKEARALPANASSCRLTP